MENSQNKTYSGLVVVTISPLKRHRVGMGREEEGLERARLVESSEAVSLFEVWWLGYWLKNLGFPLKIVVFNFTALHFVPPGSWRE
ncbi:hypothetical protein BLOT_015073 [Blomia tropicalis]|nr:hypothetical protein BLOT_015073 [Blomia tropicalis]